MVFDVDWEGMLVPDLSVLEIFFRGTAVYLFLFLLLRLVMRRQAGAVSVTDLLVVVLLADAAQNAMSADYQSVPDGLLLISTIVFWAFAMEWAGFHNPLIERLVHPPPLLLVKDGKVIPRNMRRELVTEEDLTTQIRRHGLEDISQVKAARVEGDGHISIITNGKGGATSHEPLDADPPI